MECKFILNRLVLVSMVYASIASAQTNAVSTGARIEPPVSDSLNHFGVSYRMGFNISARFKNLGGFDPQSNPRAATSGTDHTYDDGHNMVDSSGNAGNSTWFWGYDSASQLPGNDMIVMSSSSSPATGKSKEQEEDPQHGIEFTYSRELGRSEKCRWGIETAFGFTDVTIGDNRAVFGNVRRVSDAYALGGTIPPAAPYSHGFNPTGSDPLISDIPRRSMTTIPRGAVVTGQRQFESEVYGFRVGPYLEFPMCEKVSLSLNGGFALLSVHSDFRFREAVTIAGLGTQTRRGSGSQSEWLPGSYIGGNFNYAICEKVDLFAGAQYQTAGTYSHKENGKEAKLDLGNTVFLTFGIGFSF
jgi:hypothetical protein